MKQQLPLEVQLLVCPVCRTVDKLAGASALGVKGYCIGSDTDRHKKARREPVRFKEVRKPVPCPSFWRHPIRWLRWNPFMLEPEKRWNLFGVKLYGIGGGER